MRTDRLLIRLVYSQLRLGCLQTDCGRVRPETLTVTKLAETHLTRVTPCLVFTIARDCYCPLSWDIWIHSTSSYPDFYTGSLFYLTTIICHFCRVLCCACGRSHALATLVWWTSLQEVATGIYQLKWGFCRFFSGRPQLMVSRGQSVATLSCRLAVRFIDINKQFSV
jgi:hypothetical protein